MARTTYRIRGIAPPDLPSDPATRLLFWGWVRDIGLRVKDQELARGLDRDGNKLRPIGPKTRKYRRSAMTAARGRALSGPPLMPARALSRTRSLLAGRATPDAAVFYWRFDPFTGDSWGVVLAAQAKHGRDVIGLSPKGIARVRAEAWDRWRRWKAGALKLAPTPASAAPGVPRVGSYSTQHATFGIGAQQLPQFKPGKSTGGMTWPEWQRYFRRANPTPVHIPGRPAGNYNRLLAHTWGQAPPAGPKPAPTPKAPRPRPTPTSAPTVPAPAPAAAPAAASGRPRAHFERLAAYARSRGQTLEVATDALLDELRYTERERADVPAFYVPQHRRIYFNPNATLWRWKRPDEEVAATAATRWWVPRTAEGLVDHEIGHARHHAAVGFSMHDASLREPFDEDTAATIRRLVGAYAALNRGEFVAEVYAGLSAGVKYPDSVMDFYLSLGGVLP